MAQSRPVHRRGQGGHEGAAARVRRLPIGVGDRKHAPARPRAEEGRPARNNVQFEISNNDGVPRCQTTRKFRGRTSSGLASIRSFRKRRAVLASRHPSCRYPGRCRPTRISCGRKSIPPGAPLNIEDRDTIRLATLQVTVPVRSAQMADPELASVLALFRRAANVIARLEDAVVFRGLELGGARPPRLNRREGSPLPRIWEIQGGQATPGLWAPGPPPAWPWTHHSKPRRLAVDSNRDLTTMDRRRRCWCARFPTPLAS